MKVVVFVALGVDGRTNDHPPAFAKFTRRLFLLSPSVLKQLPGIVGYLGKCCGLKGILLTVASRLRGGFLSFDGKTFGGSHWTAEGRM